MKSFFVNNKHSIYAFTIPFIISLTVFICLIIYDGGIMNYIGDFDSQQLNFGRVCVEAVHSGNLGWNWNTDLGVNFIGSYSFYTIGSPFFWLTALFPASFAPYFTGPLLAVKTGFSSLFAYYYIRRFVKSPDSAVLGGIIYALSGYSMINVVFNHFHDVMCFFPLLLIALEEAVLNKRKAAFLLAVALNALVNYFFFVGECIFLVIYFIVRMCMDKRFRITGVDFCSLAFESIVGVMIAGILFLPSIYQVLDVPRSTQMLAGMDFIVHPSQRYAFLIQSLFFMPEHPVVTMMFPESEAEWSSVSLYLPLISMAGVLSFIKGNKKHWASVLISVCAVIMLIPGLNSIFTLFNSTYYGRWLYMPILVMSMMTARALEDEEYDISWGNRVCAAIVAGMILLYLLHPVDKYAANVNIDEQKILPNFLSGQISVFIWISFAVAVISVVVVAVILHRYKSVSRGELVTKLTSAVVICSLTVGLCYHSMIRLNSTYPGFITSVIQRDIKIEDDEFFRIDTGGCVNQAMMFGYPSAECFHSIVPASVYDIYELLGYPRRNTSIIPDTAYAFKSYTNTKYAVLKLKPFMRVENLGIYVYEKYSESDSYTILKNDYALPMGFTYDKYVPLSVVEENLRLSAEDEVHTTDRMMIAAVILNDEQAERYSDILSPLDESISTNESLTLERFKSDATSRIAAGVDEFVISDNGDFTAKTSYTEDELLVFSVPYDKGWSCTINGTDAEIDTVNGGFMAVRVPAGDSDIRFSYTAPGFWLGCGCSAAGIVLTAVWIAVWRYIRRRRDNEVMTVSSQVHSDDIPDKD